MINKFFKILLPIILLFFIINILLYNYKTNLSKINDNDFLFVFIGILLGFSITLFPFIVSLTEQLKVKVIEKYKDNIEKKLKIESNLRLLFKEVKHNILFIFSTLVFISSLYIMQNFSYPKSNNCFASFFEISLVLKSLRLTVFILNLYAIYDLIVVTFELSNSNTILGVED